MNVKATVNAILLISLIFLSGCGGGGGSSAPGPVVVTPPPPPPTGPTQAELEEASRFASRATFGLDYARIRSMAEEGPETWLARQLTLPHTSHAAFAKELIERRDRGEFRTFENGVQFLITFWRAAWWNRIMTAPDQLRQRVAFALSEIFVVSGNVDVLTDYPYAITTYNDVLLEGAFGNFRELLRNVAAHPAMGVYLSHMNNRKSNPDENIYPDENFAREVMQLFSIGLFELNMDGTVKTSADGRPIPTYDNDDIREFAKIFTGFSWGGDSAYFGRTWPPYFQSEMKMFDAEHEPGEKHLLNGQIVPAGQTGMQDFEDAIDNLFNHPNVGPFIAKLLIQRLVTSNPSPAYVERVARVFNGGESGERGDMAFVISAILLDPDARNRFRDATFGKLREPAVRLATLARQFNATSEDGTFYNNGYRLSYFVNQHPLLSPSVFNFFQPTHVPPGDLGARELVAPEFQITTATTIIGMTNQLDMGIFPYHEGKLFDYWEPFKKTVIDIDEYVELASDPDKLMDRLDVLLTYGRMSTETRNAILGTIREMPDHRIRAEHAIYMTLISPDYAVET